MQNAIRFNENKIKPLPLTLTQTSYSSPKGFGLIEVLISASILIIVIGGVLYLERSAIKSNILAQEKSQAFNLAREGVELVRANRDTKWVDQIINDWDEKIALGGSDEKYYKINCASNNCDLVPASDTDKETITLDNRNFERYIKVEEVIDTFNNDLINQTHVSTDEDTGNPIYTMDNTNNKILTKFKVIVEWNSGGKDYAMEIPVVLTDWKP